MNKVELKVRLNNALADHLKVEVDSLQEIYNTRKMLANNGTSVYIIDANLLKLHIIQVKEFIDEISPSEEADV